MTKWEKRDAASLAKSSLVFEDSYLPALRGTDITLRKGALAVASGPFNFVAKKSGEVLPVVVTGIETGPFEKLSDDVFARDGKGGRAQTFAAMKIFYPDLTPQTQVTAISYKPA